LSKAEFSSTGLIRILESALDTARRFEEMEGRYQANQVSFGRMQQEFGQMQAASDQLRSTTEERLEAMRALNVELKVRHSQGEQALGAVTTQLEAIKTQQGRWERSRESWKARQGGDAERWTGLEETLAALRTLAERLQARQSQLEQALANLEGLAKQQSQRFLDQEQSLRQTQKQCEQVADRQRQAELSLAASTPGNGDAAGASESTLAVMRGLVEQFEQTCDETRQIQETVKTLAGRVEQAAADGISRNFADPGSARSELSGEAAEKASAGFRHFLEQCEEEQKAAREQQNKLQTQFRVTLEGLPSMAEAAVNRFQDQSRTRLEQMWLAWAEQRQQHLAGLEGRLEDTVEKAIEARQALEKEVAKHASPAAVEPAPTASKEVLEALESASAVQQSELRFVKMLLWVTLGSVGLMGFALLVLGVFK